MGHGLEKRKRDNRHSTMVIHKLPFSPAKDLRNHPAFRSALIKRLWGWYTQRLTSAGRLLLWPTALFVAYGGLSLQIQGYVILSYMAGIWAVALLGMALRPRIALKAAFAQR